MKPLLATTGAAILCLQAQAAKLATEDFSYTVGSPINGLNGGTGFGAAWVATGTPANQTVGSTLPLSYTNGFLSMNGGATYANLGGGTNNANLLARNLTSVGSTQTELYVSFLLQFASGNIQNGDITYLFLHDNGTGDTTTNEREQAGINGNTFTALNDNTGTAAAGTPATGGTVNGLGVTNFIVFRLSRPNTGVPYNSVEVYANPSTPDRPLTATVTSTNTTGENSFFTLLGINTTGLDFTPDVLKYDMIQVGDTWGDVITPVPFGVDASLGLGLLGAAAALRLRRRASRKS